MEGAITTPNDVKPGLFGRLAGWNRRHPGFLRLGIAVVVGLLLPTLFATVGRRDLTVVVDRYQFSLVHLIWSGIALVLAVVALWARGSLVRDAAALARRLSAGGQATPAIGSGQDVAGRAARVAGGVFDLALLLFLQSMLRTPLSSIAGAFADPDLIDAGFVGLVILIAVLMLLGLNRASRPLVEHVVWSGMDRLVPTAGFSGRTIAAVPPTRPTPRTPQPAPLAQRPPTAPPSEPVAATVVAGAPAVAAASSVEATVAAPAAETGRPAPISASPENVTPLAADVTLAAPVAPPAEARPTVEPAPSLPAAPVAPGSPESELPAAVPPVGSPGPEIAVEPDESDRAVVGAGPAEASFASDGTLVALDSPPVGPIEPVEDVVEPTSEARVAEPEAVVATPAPAAVETPEEEPVEASAEVAENRRVAEYSDSKQAVTLSEAKGPSPRVPSTPLPQPSSQAGREQSGGFLAPAGAPDDRQPSSGGWSHDRSGETPRAALDPEPAPSSLPEPVSLETAEQQPEPAAAVEPEPEPAAPAEPEPAVAAAPELATPTEMEPVVAVEPEPTNPNQTLGHSVPAINGGGMDDGHEWPDQARPLGRERTIPPPFRATVPDLLANAPEPTPVVEPEPESAAAAMPEPAVEQPKPTPEARPLVEAPPLDSDATLVEPADEPAPVAAPEPKDEAPAASRAEPPAPEPESPSAAEEESARPIAAAPEPEVPTKEPAQPVPAPTPAEPKVEPKIETSPAPSREAAPASGNAPRQPEPPASGQPPVRPAIRWSERRFGTPPTRPERPPETSPARPAPPTPPARPEPASPRPEAPAEPPRPAIRWSERTFVARPAPERRDPAEAASDRTVAGEERADRTIVPDDKPSPSEPRSAKGSGVPDARTSSDADATQLGGD